MQINSDFILVRTKDGFTVQTKNCKNSFLLKSTEYYEELACLVEALKAEGWWNSEGRISISNKSPELINYFERLFAEHKITAHKNALIKIKIPPLWIEKEKIRVVKNGNLKKFHFGKNGFTKELDTVVFTDKAESAEYFLEYEQEKLDFKTLVSEEELSTNSKDARIYLDVRASNKTFVKFVNFVLKEKTNSLEIRVNEELKKASPELVAKVFGCLIDCEGSIRHTGFTRYVYTRMKNREYLEDWHCLLEKMGINSRIGKADKGLTGLTITCNQNFSKLEKLGFVLRHKTKRQRFKEIVESYKRHQLRRNTALDIYLAKVRENPNTSALDLSKIVKKDKRTVSHYLKRLTDKGKVKTRAVGQKYLYSSLENAAKA